jgi:hypothetical protein
VGAFLVGFIARLLKKRLPLLASDGNLHAIQMFASFFVPFYFFCKTDLLRADEALPEPPEPPAPSAL